MLPTSMAGATLAKSVTPESEFVVAPVACTASKNRPSVGQVGAPDIFCLSFVDYSSNTMLKFVFSAETILFLVHVL